MPAPNLDEVVIKYLIRQALIAKVKDQAMGHLILKVPLLSLPIIGTMASMAVSYMLNFLIDNTLIGANILLIEIDVNADIRNLEKAAAKAKAAYLSKKKADIEKADEELIDAARDIISYSGRVF